MKRSIFLFMMILVIWPIAAQETSLQSGIVGSHNSFAVKIYERLRSGEGNLVYSPFSMYVVLAQAYGGAGSTTADQLAELLNVSVPDEEFHSAVAALMSGIRGIDNEGGPELSIAGALWPQDRYPILPSFLELMELYGSTIKPLDYANHPEEARRIINNWAKENTNGLIDNFLPSRVFSSNTRLNLSNAIYFKGLWTSRFNKNDTATMPFFSVDGTESHVEMMGQLNKFGYMEDEGIQILSLPYEGDTVSMIIFLPENIDGIGALEKSLSAEGIAGYMKYFFNPYRDIVDVRLPRFSIRYQVNATDILKEMGVTDAFERGVADFSGIDGEPRWLFAEHFFHDALIEVDEEGTKAAAVTLGGGGCFPAGTVVVTSAGTVPIEDIVSGVRVPAYNLKSRKWKETTVTGVEKRRYEGDIISIRTEGQTIESTGNHPFFVINGTELSSRPRPADLPMEEPASINSGRWVEARDLRTDDILLGRDGYGIPILGTADYVDSFDVYNLRIDGFHNYCVGDSGILVHNKGSAEEKPVYFYADHPFLYMIVEQKTGCILFMGRVMEP